MGDVAIFWHAVGDDGCNVVVVGDDGLGAEWDCCSFMELSFRIGSLPDSITLYWSGLYGVTRVVCYADDVGGR